MKLNIDNLKKWDFDKLSFPESFHLVVLVALFLLVKKFLHFLFDVDLSYAFQLIYVHLN